MKVLGKKALVLVLMLTPMMATVAWADDAELLKRIERLERIVKGQGLVSLLGRVDQLQNDVQRLNGDNELLRHELKTMQQRQRELYIDLDQRLQTQTVIAPTTEAVSTDQTPETGSNQPPAIESGTPTQIAAADNTVNTGTSPVAVENGEAAYQSALQTLRSGQYEQAITALAAFPEQYPQSSYLPNTYYWQGEANYVLRKFAAAVTAFQTVITKFPASSKVADAMLKLGFSQYELKQMDDATATLAKVMEQYPNTSAARLANVRLIRIAEQSR